MIAALHYDSTIFEMYHAPISQEVERGLPRPLQPNSPFDLDTVIPHPVAWPHKPWNEFEVDNVVAVFSTWSVQEADGIGFRQEKMSGLLLQTYLRCSCFFCI